MVTTRSMHRSRRRTYRSRTKSSVCRGKTAATCRRRIGCKKTRHGKRKSYCRKRSNKRV